MTYQEFVKEYVGLDEDIINELHKNLPCLKQISIDDIRAIQTYPDDGFRNLYIREIQTHYTLISEDYKHLIAGMTLDVHFPFWDFTKISQDLIELKISLDVVLKLYINLRKIYLKLCGYDK